MVPSTWRNRSWESWKIFHIRVFWKPTNFWRWVSCSTELKNFQTCYHGLYACNDVFHRSVDLSTRRLEVDKTKSCHFAQKENPKIQDVFALKNKSCVSLNWKDAWESLKAKINKLTVKASANSHCLGVDCKLVAEISRVNLQVPLVYPQKFDSLKRIMGRGKGY